MRPSKSRCEIVRESVNCWPRFEIALGQDEPRLGRGDLAFGARHIGGIERRIDQKSRDRPV